MKFLRSTSIQRCQSGKVDLPIWSRWRQIVTTQDYSDYLTYLVTILTYWWWDVIGRGLSQTVDPTSNCGKNRQVQQLRNRI
jgi:hypothetical protein